jgi:hypothetical protein
MLRSLVERWDKMRKINSSERVESGSEYEVLARFEGCAAASLDLARRFAILEVPRWCSKIIRCKKWLRSVNLGR